MDGSEGVDSCIVTAIVMSRSAEDALLTDSRPEILLVDSQCCLPNAIEPMTNKPSVSLQGVGALLMHCISAVWLAHVIGDELEMHLARDCR